MEKFLEGLGHWCQVRPTVGVSKLNNVPQAPNDILRP
jgi:hypothetical protein